LKDSADAGFRAWRTLLRSHARILQVLDAELEQGAGLSIRSYEVLVRLARSPRESLRMSELAASVWLSPSGVTRLVDQLVDRRLVSRRRDPTDARSYLAELTKDGRAAFKRAKRLHDQTIQEHFSNRLSEDQLILIAEALSGLDR